MASRQSTLHVPRTLEDFVLAYRPDMKGYLFGTLFPKKSVKHKSDDIRREDKGNLLRLRNLQIGSNGRLQDPVSMRFLKNLRYVTTAYGVLVPLDWDERANADSEVQYDQRQTEHGLIAVHTQFEFIAVKSVARNVALYGTQTVNYDGTPDQYSNKFNIRVDPVDDFLYICGEIENRTSHRPNSITMHSRTWDTIVQHPVMRARAEREQGGGAIISVEQFEKMIRVEKGTIKTTAATYNVSDSDNPDDADFRSFIGPDILFAYNEPGTVNSQGFGQTFMFAGNTEGAGMRAQSADADLAPAGDIMVRAYDDPAYGKDGATMVKITGEWDCKVVNNQAGFLLRNAVDGTDTSLYGNFLNN